jgi:hypothetical protein
MWHFGRPPPPLGVTYYLNDPIPLCKMKCLWSRRRLFQQFGRWQRTARPRWRPWRWPSQWRQPIRDKRNRPSLTARGWPKNTLKWPEKVFCIQYRCGLFICNFAYMRLKIGLFKVPIPYIIVIRSLFICEFVICEPNFLLPIFRI